MKPSFIGKTLACVLLCSCASSSVLTSADAPDQTVLNVDGSPIPLKAATFERRKSELERNNLMQRIMELSNELSRLRAQLARVAGPEVPDPSVVSPVPATPAPLQEKAGTGTAARSVATATSRINRETIVLQENGMVFRVMHDYAKTEFRPSESLQQQLLQAARAGKRIDIRGRTDARVENEADHEIALQRALNARVFLANNGIHPGKMHLSVMAAGDNVADNSTPAGRARNRRVDVETAGIKPEVMEKLASVILQGLQ